jgi:hypothetical protein
MLFLSMFMFSMYVRKFVLLKTIVEKKTWIVYFSIKKDIFQSYVMTIPSLACKHIYTQNY